MKNKRKYEDQAPATASDITQKNLKKLKKLTKKENPVVKDIRSKGTEFLADRKNANMLVELLALLDPAEPASSIVAAIQAMKRIFIVTMDKQTLKKPKDGDGSGEAVWSGWMLERLEDGFKRLLDLVNHKKASVVNLAVSTIMNLLQSQNLSRKTKGWSSDELKTLQNLVLCFASTKTSSQIPLAAFQEFLVYSDVSLHFLSVLSRIVSKAVTGEKTNFIFVDNIVSCLETFQMPAETEYKASKAFMKSDEENPSEPDYQQLKKNFGSLWITTLRCKFNLDQYKRSLILLNEKVIPLLPRPLLVTDFLLSCYAVGGAISMLALSGVFTLISKYNLEYPEFYTKLYQLFTIEIFHVKYKARFFHMSDVFLSSTHLPENLVAAFVKRIARLALQAPAESVPLCIKFIHNLLHRHRGLVNLIDSADRTDLTSDPYDAEAVDPTASRASESSLWELKSLTNHLLPEVSTVAKDLFEKGVREQEMDVSASLETTAEDLFETELKKKVFVNVPINFKAPDGFKFPSEDYLSEIFEFA